MFLIIFSTFLVVFVLHYFTSNRKFFGLPSPGVCLPVIGHAYKMVCKEAQNDPVNFLWDLWKNNNHNGIMWMRMFNMDMALIGDFDTAKYVFNHPDVQVGI